MPTTTTKKKTTRGRVRHRRSAAALTGTLREARTPYVIRARIRDFDIDHGECCSLQDCPVALAIKRRLRLKRRVYVYPGHVNVWGRRRLTIYDHDADDFIKAFDMGEHAPARTVTLTVRTRNG